MPGDRVRAVVTKRKKAYAEARTVALLERRPGAHRGGRADHPGAPWQVLPYERQIAIKAEQVDDALRRIGRLDGYELEPLVPAIEQWRYRNKLEYSFGTDDGALVCGFHAPGSWERIEPLEDCLLASEAGNAGAARGAAVVPRARAWPPTTAARRPACCATSSCARAGAPAICRCASSPPTSRSTLDGLRRSGRRRQRRCGRGRSTSARPPPAAATEVLHGTEAIEEELGGLRFRISADAFFQTNTEMAERLYAIAAEYAGLQGWERVYDLFCGIGTIGLSLAPRAGEVWGLEIVEDAIADAIANARRNEIDNARFFAGDVRLALRELVETARAAPTCWSSTRRAPACRPRSCAASSRPGPTRIVYVSCNPTTLAPNAAQLGRGRLRTALACGRSTCSRRPRTSSAWRCWNASSTRSQLSPRASPRRASGSGSSTRSSTPSSSATRQTSRRSSSTSTHAPADAGKTTWSPGRTGICTPAASHQSTPWPTASTIPCCGGGSCEPGGHQQARTGACGRARAP